MTAAASEDTCVLEDPNAVRHMDALFDVLHKPSIAGRSDFPAPGAEMTRGEADVEFLLDALFAVVQSDGGDGGRRAAGRTRTAAKTWKERELPASFFDAGGSAGTPVDEAREETLEAERSEAEDAPNSPIPSSESASSTQTSDPAGRPGLDPMPVVLVANTSSADSLTFYIE